MRTNLKVNKKVLQLLAAMLILVFHLWINVSGTEIENFLRSIAYVGVDIFFFVSVYSLSQRYDETFDYKSFIKNRFRNIYLKYLIFLFIAILYKGYKSFIFKIFGIELFIKGGGAFLWFVPAIMITYLLFPFFLKWNNKYKSVIVLVIYLITSILVSSLTGYKEIFIFLNRLPVMLVAYELSKREIHISKLVGLIGILLSLILLYKFGYRNKLNIPIYDIYYVFAIFFVLGLLPLVSDIRLNKVFDQISKSTLEIYAVQMIVGFDILNKLYRYLKNALVANILTMVIVIGLSLLFKYLFDKASKKINF